MNAFVLKKRCNETSTERPEVKKKLDIICHIKKLIDITTVSSLGSL